MESISEITPLRDRIRAWRAAAERIVLVPTMGNLHAGHLRLVEIARTKGQRVVVSIFVNPLQFSAGEDFQSYPRTLQDDQEQLAQLDTDILFIPDSDLIYPAGVNITTQVVVPELSGILCGLHRKGHFEGVATIVAKLFNLIQPNTAIFGKKDFQQLVIIRRLVEDLNFPVEVLGGDTVREHDGLAMSSRNRYLGSEERNNAPELFKMLSYIAEAIKLGDRAYQALQDAGKERLLTAGFEVDYVEIRDAGTLAIPNSETRNLVILGAAHLGAARLIDNLEISI